MKYILAGIVLAVLIGTARGEIVDLGGGEYKAIIQSDSSQTGPNWNMSVVNYDSCSHSHTLNTAYTYTGRYDNLFYGDNEKYRNWHEFSLWQIPDDAIIDSVILVVRSYILYGDSISIDVVNLNSNRPSFQSPQDLWNQIGAAMTYVNNTKIYWSSYEPKWRLPGAENTIQSRLGTANEWFATGFRSNWENRDSVLLDAFPIELWVYFKVEPHVHVEKPNGGEIFYIGLEDTIQWTASDYDNYVDYVYILLSRDGGNSYTLIGQVTNTLHSNPWSGEYVWHVIGPESHQCKIRIIAYDTDGLQSRDESDNVFSIENMPRPQTELLWPNSPGITVEEADTYAIRYNGEAVAGIQQVKAWFSYDGGQTWPDTIGSHPYQPPNYPTHVENHTIDWPVTQHPTEHGRVKVVLYDAANQTAVDTSDYDITVIPATPSNITANVSENYRQVTLTWTDRSRYNSGYEIQRIDEEGNVRTITINDSDATTYVDHTVAPFHTYDYKIRAINNDGLASEWVTERVYNTPTFLVPINPSLSSVSSKVMHKGNKEYIAVSQPIVGNDGKLQGVVILLKTSLDGINWTTEDTVYRLTTGSSISSFDFDIIPVDLQNGVKFAGLATYQLDNRTHVDFITYSGVGLHGVIEVFSGDGEAKHPTLIWNRESNNVGINFSVANRIYWAEYTLSNTVSILGYVDLDELFSIPFIISLSPLKVDGVDVAEFPWGVVLNGRNTHSENEIIALYGDDGYSYVILDTTPAWRGYVDSYNNRVVWASEEGIKEAVIDGVADMIWVDRTEVITQDITGESVFSLNYSQNSYGDEVVGATVKDTGFVSKYIAFTRPAGNTQWSLRIIGIKHEYPVLCYGGISFSNRYRGRAGIYQKYLIIYHIAPCCTNTDTLFFKERSFKVKDEIVIRPDIMKGDLSSIHHGDSNYIFFSRYGYVNYVQSDNAVTGWSRENILCKGYNPVAVHTDSSFTVFYVRNDSLFARTHSDGFENEHFVVEMGQFSPGYGVSYSDGNYYVVYEEMAGQMTDDTLFTPQSWSLKTAVVSSDFSVIREETLDHTEDGLPTGVNPYRSQGRRVSIGSFNGYRYVLAVKPGSGVKLYRNDSGAWESRSVNIGNGPYGNLNIKVDDKTVYLTWSDGGTVYYRFLYAGDPGFISKAIELSSGDNPNYGGKAIFWSDGNKLEKMSLALEDEPAELMTAGTGDISNTALTFYTVGGEYYQTSVYLSALMIKDGSSNMLGVNVYSTGPIPEQVITLGDTIPTPKTIERSGFEEYSDEKGKSADVGDRLSYRITDLKPNEYYRLGLYIYHEEEDDITEQFYLDGKPVKSELIQKGKETYIELEVPEEMYVEDSTVVLEVEKESGPVAVLNEIYVFGKPIPGSGPMSEEEVMLIPETYRVMSISPNPMRGRGEIVLGIPEDGKVRVDVYNIEGRRVKELFNGMVRKGYYRVRVEGLESGMYFVVVRGEHGKAMKKMMVLR